MPTGYCTVDDVRRALRAKELPGGAAQDREIVIDAIASLTDLVERATLRHWFAEEGAEVLEEDGDDLIPTEPRTRDDEHDIPTRGGFVHGSSERRRRRRRKNSDALLESGPNYDRRRRHDRRLKREIRIATGEYRDGYQSDVPAYTRITLGRKDVSAVNELHVVNVDGGYDDWTEELEGGVGNTHRGEDYWVRVNNLGVTELYLDVHAMDDDLATLSNAVYVDVDYGLEGLPREVRRAVAMLAAAELLTGDEAALGIPDNGQFVAAESKIQVMERQALAKLEAHVVNPELLEDYR